jgi:molecular chaperone DnaK (HSP70)
MPAGIPKIDVTFLIDQNGILNVSAREQRSGKMASVQIIPSHGLTREEVRHMQEEAIKYAREDMTAHHLIDVRAAVEFDLNKAEQMIERYGRLIDDARRRSLVAAIADLRAFAGQTDDPVALNERREVFNRSTTSLAERAMTATLQVDKTNAPGPAAKQSSPQDASSPSIT